MAKKTDLVQNIDLIPVNNVVRFKRHYFLKFVTFFIVIIFLQIARTKSYADGLISERDVDDGVGAVYIARSVTTIFDNLLGSFFPLFKTMH